MDSKVITSSDLQVMYEQLYTFMMQYLWEFPVVQDLANLEIAVFKRFPDKDEMSKCIRELNYDISATYNELEDMDQDEFKKAFEKLETAIEEFENPGCELYAVQEIVDDPDNIEASAYIDESDSESEKRPFRFGDISKRSAEERRLQEEAINTLSNPFETTAEEGEE